MKKLIVLVDLDDVMENLLEVWTQELNDFYGLDVKPEDITEWDICKFYPGISTKAVFQPLNWACFWDKVRPKEGAIENIQRLINDGHEVYVVTNSNPMTIHIKLERMFKKYYSFIPVGNIIIATNKQMVKGDVLIDDAPHNLIGGEYKKILFDMPHNAYVNCEAHGLVRAKDWNAVYNIVCNIAQEE